MSKITHIFLFGLVLYLSFYAVFGDVLGRNDLSDKSFHLERSLHPLSFQGGYYAPLLHLMIYPLTFFMPVKLAASLVVPFILFFLFPASFLFAWCAFDYDNLDAKSSNFYAIFVLYLIPFCMFNCTWAQALNMSFALFALGLMFLDFYEIRVWRERVTLPLIVICVALGILSHTEGGLWLLVVFFAYLLLQDRWKSIILFTIFFAAVFTFFPFMLVRPASLISSAAGNLGVNLWEFVRILLLWTFPVTLYLIYVGFKARILSSGVKNGAGLEDLVSQLYCSDVLLLISAVAAILCVPFDSEYRSLLTVMVLLGLYGVYGLQKHPRLKPLYVAYQLFWALLLGFGLVVSYTL